METLSFFCILAVAVLGIVTKMNWKKSSVLTKVLHVAGIIKAVVVFINSCGKQSEDRLRKQIESKFGDIGDLVGAEIPKIRISVSKKCKLAEHLVCLNVCWLE